jgi:hypothetical protein
VSSATGKGEYGDDERSTADEGSDAEESSDYLRFCLNSNEVVEGKLSRVISPIRVTLTIERIDGIDITVSKHSMQTTMLDKCPKLPVLDNIAPGTLIIITK